MANTPEAEGQEVPIGELHQGEELEEEVETYEPPEHVNWVYLGICTGNPWVLLSIPVPIPATHNPQVTSHGSWRVLVSSVVVATKIHLFNYILNYNYLTLQAGARRHGVHHQ